MTTEANTKRTEHPHIVRVAAAAGEKAVISGTRIAVWFIVGQLRVGDTAEDIVASLPHLTLAGVYDAISYYYDHPDEIDAILAERERLANEPESASHQTG